MKVLKFGGTSVGTTASLRNVKAIVDGLDSPAVVVVSALGGLTDKLIETAHKAAGADSSFRDEMEAIRHRHFNIIEDVVPVSSKADVLTKVTALLNELSDIYTGLSLIKDLPAKTLNQVVSFGERMSSIIVAAMIENGVHLDSLEVVKTEKWFNKDIANRQVTDANIRSSIPLPLQRTVVAGGFISRDINTGEITNLGRGGSDYTAALIAASLNADSLEIWTDVDGFMTADPRIIPDARVIPHMSFIESMELCSFGAKVIYPPTIYPVFHKNIPIKILNTHNPSAPGTLITDSTGTEKGSIRGISPMKKISVITLEGDLASNVAEINTRTYNAMARNGISMFLVSQPDKESTFSFSLTTADADKALDILNSEFAPELQGGEIRNISLVKDMSIIAVVGEKIKDLVGLEARITYILKRNDIEVFAVSNGASETTITIVVSEEMVNKALQLVHGACF
jgi:aspartokinase/homoserine dehydrogenase 1